MSAKRRRNVRETTKKCPRNDEGLIGLLSLHIHSIYILASLPTIKLALAKGASVMVCSHLGRPTEGETSAENSLLPVAAYLSKALARPVSLIENYVDGYVIPAGEVVLFENVRFNKAKRKTVTN